MKGTLYGVGIGPGDPELLTLKAVRIIKESPVIAVPGKVKEDTVAYKIVKQAIPELDEKEFLAVDMPMTKDKAMLQKSHDEGADQVCEILESGRSVAFHLSLCTQEGAGKRIQGGNYQRYYILLRCRCKTEYGAGRKGRAAACDSRILPD